MTIQEFIDTTVRAWSEEMLATRIAAAERRKLVATGALKRMRTIVQDEAIKDGARIQLIMQEYGRIQDMKGVKWSPNVPIENIKDWIEAKGVEKFKRRHRRLYGRREMTRDQLIHQIAWSIRSGKEKQKRRRWYSRGLWGAIFDLYDDLLIGLADPALEDIKSIITAADGSKAG